MITEEELNDGKEAIYSIQKFVPIEVARKDEVQYKSIVGMHLYDKADIQEYGHEHYYHDENCTCGHDHHHTVSSFTLETDKLMSIERFDYWLNWLLDLCNYDLLRYKGILCFQDTEE